MGRSRWLAAALLFVASAAHPHLQSPSLNEQLIAAARKGDAAAVKSLLAEGADVNARTGYDITPLMFAADNADAEVVRVLLDHGADPDARDLEYGKTALYLVSYSGTDRTKRKAREEIVALLVEKGANPGVALENLIEEGYYDAAERVIRRAIGAAASSGPGAVDPVFLNHAVTAAKRAGQKPLVDLLVSAGAKDRGPADSSRATERLKQIAGTYRSQSGQELTLRVIDDELLLDRPGQRRLALNPALYEVGLFRSYDHKVVATLKPGPVPPKDLTLIEGGRTEAFNRVGEAPVLTRAPSATPTIAARRDSPVAGASPATMRQPASPHWPAFRGLGSSGVAIGARPPTTWDAEKGTNIRWKTRIPGLAHSSPVVWGNRIFITTAAPKDGGDVTFLHGAAAGDAGSSRRAGDRVPHSFRVYALEKTSGRILWERVAHEAVPRTDRHVMQSQADSTPVTDGTHVVAWFGSEGVFCYDIDGKLLWKQDLGNLVSGMYQYPDYEWKTAGSPIIYKNLVIVQVDLLDPKDSFIAAYDVKTGKQVWRTARDERASWTTPLIYEGPTRTELVTAAGDFARGYDPETGKELWRFAKHSIFPTPTPLAGPGLIYITSGGGVTIQPIYALRPGARGDITLADGETSNDYIAWSKRRGGPYLPTPVLYGDLLYVFSNNGILAAYDARSGARAYQERISQGGSYSASPVAADGKLYFASEDGEVVVVKAGPTFERLAVNRMGEVMMATPAISEDLIIIRTQHHLFGIGEGRTTDSTRK